MENYMQTASCGHCALRDDNNDQCSIYSGANGLLVCVSCDRFNAPLTDQQIAELRAQPDAVVSLITQVISGRRHEPMPFKFNCIYRTIGEVQYLGKTREPGTRIILDRQVAEGDTLQMEISYGRLTNKQKPQLYGYSLESPQLLEPVPHAVAVTLQKLNEQGFQYLQNENDMWGAWTKGYPMHFIKYETLRPSLSLLGITVALTICE